MKSPVANAKAYTTITRCRVCGSPDINPLYSLGDLYVSDFVEKPSQGIKAPLEMVMCGNCTLVQLRDTAPQELLYARFYWYRSGVTDTMRKALRNITESIEKRMDLKAGDIVLDIGSNDGTMLRTYAVPGLIKVGVEPASNLAEEGKVGLEYFINDFWTKENYDKVLQPAHRSSASEGGKKAKVITAIGMFYDMEDPNQFISDAAAALQDDGIFIAQLMCLKNMLDTNDVGNICHEHLEFYSLASLEFLLEKNGLTLLDIEHNLVNGGSYRVYAGLKNGKPPAMPEGAAERLAKYRSEESDMDSKKNHAEFFARIEESKRQCVAFIKDAVAKGAKLWTGGPRQGLVIPPSLLEGVPADCRLSCEEAFGPVATLDAVDSREEALERMAATRFGLQAGIFTNDLAFVQRAFDRLPVGGLIVNDIPTFRSDAMPYGGMKDSGIGREGVRYAMDDFTEQKTLVLKS